MLVSEAEKMSKEDELKMVPRAFNNCASFSTRVQFVEAETRPDESFKPPTEQSTSESSSESSKESEAPFEESFKESPGPSSTKSFEPPSELLSSYTSAKSSKMSELSSEAIGAALDGTFNSLSAFNVDAIVTPSFLMRSTSERSASEPSISESPTSGPPIFEPPTSILSTSVPSTSGPATSKAQEYSAKQAELQTTSRMWQNPSQLTPILPAKQPEQSDEPFPPPPFLLNSSYNSPFATTPRYHANGKPRTFGVLSSDSTNKFWNFSSFDPNLRSASLGRQRNGSGIAPLRLSQVSGLLSIPTTNPFTKSIGSLTNGVNGPSNAVVPANSLRPSSIYAKDPEEIDDQEERERMRSIEFLLLMRETKETNGDSFELKSSFNHQKSFDRRIPEDANREMINEYLLQRQNDQAETKLFQPIDEEASVKSEKSDRSFEKQDIAIDIPTPTISSSPNRRRASSGSSKDHPSSQRVVRFKNSKDLHNGPQKKKKNKKFPSDKPLTRRQKCGIAILNFFLYCSWILITNILLLTFFWIYI